MAKASWVLLIWFLFYFSSCSKENKCNCRNEGKGTSDVSSFTTFNEMGISRTFPCFNPMNEHEIVYYKKDNILKKYQIIKYNIATKKEDILADKVVYSRFSWNKSGLIAFSSNDYGIWTIHDDGSNLLKITNKQYNLDPHWLNHGDTIVFHFSKDLSVNRKIYLYSNGAILDSVENTGISNSTDVSPIEVLFVEYPDDKVIKKLNLINKQKVDLFARSGLGTLNGLAYSNNNIFYSENSSDMRIYNIPSKTSYKFKGGCLWKSYGCLDISSSGRYLITTKLNIKTDDNVSYEYWEDILLYDLELGQETLLF